MSAVPAAPPVPLKKQIGRLDERISALWLNIDQYGRLGLVNPLIHPQDCRELINELLDERLELMRRAVGEPSSL